MSENTHRDFFHRITALGTSYHIHSNVATGILNEPNIDFFPISFGAYCNHGQVIDEKVYWVEDLGQINKNMVGDVHLLGQTTDYGNVLENILAVESSWQVVENVDVLVPRYVK